MRRGFTLVELLVVIGIIGILTALLLPAVQRSREAARRTQCANNLHQLALAVHKFEDVHKRLPTYFGYFPEKGQNRLYGSWAVHILPYLEQNNLHEAIAATGGAYGSVATLNQPASPNYQPAYWIIPPGCAQVPSTTTGGGTSSTNYQGHTYDTTGSTSMVWQPPGCATYVPAVGTPATYNYSYLGIDAYSDNVFKVFLCPSDPDGLATRKFRYSREWSHTNYEANFNAWTENKRVDIPARPTAITDGYSNTVMFAEAMRFCDRAGKFAFWSDYKYLHSHTFGVNWEFEENTYMFQRAASAKTCNNWRLQALHHGPINVAMFDGSVRMLGENITRRETTDPMDAAMGGNAVMGPTPGAWDNLLLPADGMTPEDY